MYDSENRNWDDVQKTTGDCRGEYSNIDESLMERRHVRGEGRRVVNRFSLGAIKMGEPKEEGVSNSVPAAAVIRRIQALSGFIGLKGCVGGPLSQR